MFKLDDNLLVELGLGSLVPSEKNRMLNHIYETLEMRVGMKLAQRMSNEQLDEFEEFINRNDDAGALKWLESNFPNYKQVVAEELEALKQEIKVSAPQIISASQQQAMMPQQPVVNDGIGGAQQLTESQAIMPPQYPQNPAATLNQPQFNQPQPSVMPHQAAPPAQYPQQQPPVSM